MGFRLPLLAAASLAGCAHTPNLAVRPDPAPPAGSTTETFKVTDGTDLSRCAPAAPCSAWRAAPRLSPNGTARTRAAAGSSSHSARSTSVRSCGIDWLGDTRGYNVSVGLQL
ncbi:MAG: hypothetical protein H0T79_02730 [Deltaproteobacteria bacterium]|nr:hypothetical protein [Deltaproteobacteria bacterium]